MNNGSQQRELNFVPGAQPEGPSAWLHAYAILVTASILVLICSGGLVTSKNAGLSVPDWPTTYGYNMFVFPISRWVGGVLYEHAHRLIASGVGFLTLGLAVWLWLAERRRWVRVLGVVALVAVIVQAVLGGLRVVELNAAFGIFHACLAQAFLALVALIALVTSGWWQRPPRAGARPARSYTALSTALGAVAILIYSQLALGATMRHAHAGLSIPDFPTAYGQAWPHIDAAQLAEINRYRNAVLHLPPTTLIQIQLQMGHRMLAGLIFVAVLGVAGLTWCRKTLLPKSLYRLTLGGPVLITCQIALGIATIWTQKAADVATAHVAVGAISLVWAVLTFAALSRWLLPVAGPIRAISQTPQRVEAGV